MHCFDLNIYSLGESYYCSLQCLKFFAKIILRYVTQSQFSCKPIAIAYRWFKLFKRCRQELFCCSSFNADASLSTVSSTSDSSRPVTKYDCMKVLHIGHHREFNLSKQRRHVQACLQGKMTRVTGSSWQTAQTDSPFSSGIRLTLTNLNKLFKIKTYC